MSGRPVPRHEHPDPRPRSDAPHAAGALLWGVVTQVRYPRVLGLFLVSGLAVAAAAFVFTGVGGLTAAGSPLTVPLALLAVGAWTVAYRYVSAALDADREFHSAHLHAGVRKLPDLVLVYGTLVVGLYAVLRLSFLLFSGHYAPRFAFFVVSAVVLIHSALATPAVLIGDVPTLGSLAAAWERARGIRLTLAGIWFVSAIVAFSYWYLFWRLVEAYAPTQALLLFGAAVGIFLGGFHLALVHVYDRSPASTSD